jgi:cardiolipin synthase
MPVVTPRGPAAPSVVRPQTLAPAATTTAPATFQPGEKKDVLADAFEKAGKLFGFLGAEAEAKLNPWKHLSNWEDDSRKMTERVQKSEPLPGKDAPALSDPRFLAGLEDLTGAKFHQGSQVSLLADGPKACDAWVDAIGSAKSSVHMQSWAFYDDATGGRIAEALVQKAQAGADVRVMVDGQVAQEAAHKHVLEYMEQHGVKVLRWRNPDRDYYGLHSKVLVVDGNSGDGKVIAGGRNPGDWYFDTNPQSAKWRDTELAGKGPMVIDAESLFARRWNDQVKSRQLQFGQVAVPKPPVEVPTGARVAVVGNDPKIGDQSDDKILLATLKAIQGAKKSFDIENAYFIVQSPGSRDALREALEDAIKRGVKVRIFTNSDKSVDEAVVSTPIMNSAIEMAHEGAQVYLKQGDTLHSKYWVADGELAMVASYNNHPRSHYYEAESAMLVADPGFAAQIGKHFEEGVAAATPVGPGTPLKPESLGSRLGGLFEDQL